MNGKIKKVLLAALVVVVFMVLAAGMASARGRGGRGGRWDDRGRGDYGYSDRGWDNMGYCGMPCDGYGRGPRGGGWGRGYGMRGGMGYGYGRNFGAAEIPQEIRDKFAEADKIAADLRNELSKAQLDRAKVLELHAKRDAIMREISSWSFQQRLDEQIAR